MGPGARKLFRTVSFQVITGIVALISLLFFIYIFVYVHWNTIKFEFLVQQSYFNEESNSATCRVPFLRGKCLEEVKTLNATWHHDPCYAQWGVDGSDCSIVRYLSEIKDVCPSVIENGIKNKAYERLQIRNDFRPLYEAFNDHYAWIERRIERMEKKWIEVGRKLSTRPYFKKWSKKKILINPGVVIEDNKSDFAKGAFSGGPLGELVQWSDLIAALFVLGHDVVLLHSRDELLGMFKEHEDVQWSGKCPIKNAFDILYTDIIGLRAIEQLSKGKFNILKHYRCNLRVLDCFGTEAAYNHPKYILRKTTLTGWGSWNLNLKQFSTMFPHTPDNTFLGFVIERVDGESNTVRNTTKDHIALVYGKENYYWKGKQNYLDAIQELIPLHAAAQNKKRRSNIPKYVNNHGPLPESDYHDLLQSAKIFVGLGFPVEGPAALEAIAAGTVFLNPVFEEESLSKIEVDDYFENKPTSRRLESQNSYAQKFIGLPHVRMVHLQNLTEVQTVVKDILASPPVEGYMPHEFTALGMIERVGFHTEEYEFCFKRKAWPPLSVLQIAIARKPSTCSDACMEKGLVCEPHFFPDINRRSTFLRLDIECNEYETPEGKYEEIDYPAYSGTTCFLQGNSKLFSCAGRYTEKKRLCPCRSFIKGHVALCKGCYGT